MSLTDWKDTSQIIGTFVAIPGVFIAAWKTFREVQKLREEKERDRRSRVHQRQLDKLCELYQSLHEVQEYSQLMTKSIIFEGEKPEAYPRLLHSAMTEAHQSFVATKLLLPDGVVKHIEAFFQKFSEGQIYFGLAQRAELLNSSQGSQYWTRAATIAHQELPVLLRTIEQSAREIIHGQSA